MRLGPVYCQPKVLLLGLGGDILMLLRLPQRGGEHQNIISVAHDPDSQRLHLLGNFVQLDVGKERRDDPSLWASDVGFLHCAILHDSCLEEVAYELQYPPITYLLVHSRNDAFMAQRAKALGQVHVYHVSQSISPEKLLCFGNHQLTGAVRAKAVS